MNNKIQSPRLSEKLVECEWKASSFQACHSTRVYNRKTTAQFSNAGPISVCVYCHAHAHAIHQESVSSSLSHRAQLDVTACLLAPPAVCRKLLQVRTYLVLCSHQQAMTANLMLSTGVNRRRQEPPDLSAMLGRVAWLGSYRPSLFPYCVFQLWHWRERTLRW